LKLDTILRAFDQQEQSLLDDIKTLREARASLEKINGTARSEEGTQPLTQGIPPVDQWSGVGITEGAERLLTTEGPMDTRDIADALRARGVKTKSTSFIPTVYASLRESKRFVRLKDARKWDLASSHPTLAAEQRHAQAPPPKAVKKRGKGKRGAAK
jgi:hypothetical protein